MDGWGGSGVPNRACLIANSLLVEFTLQGRLTNSRRRSGGDLSTVPPSLTAAPVWYSAGNVSIKVNF